MTRLVTLLPIFILIGCSSQHSTSRVTATGGSVTANCGPNGYIAIERNGRTVTRRGRNIDVTAEGAHATCSTNRETERAIVRRADEDPRTIAAQRPRIEPDPPTWHGASPGNFGCFGDCRRLEEDVRRREGFHVVGTVADNTGMKLVHVADTCQHFFCGIDDDCTARGGSDHRCIQPTNCVFVGPRPPPEDTFPEYLETCP